MKYLQKILHPAPIAKDKLCQWVEKYEGINDENGKDLFSTKTKKTVLEQCRKIDHVQDVPGVDMCIPMPPCSNATIPLTQWVSKRRPESWLEKFHELVMHLASTETNAELADVITLGGVANHNMKCRWKAHVNRKKLLGEYLDPLCHFEDTPPIPRSFNI